jgi:hypothetical protein
LGRFFNRDVVVRLRSFGSLHGAWLKTKKYPTNRARQPIAAIG